MPTTKRRIPVPLSGRLEKVVENFSQVHNLSLSQGIVILLEQGLENAEDEYFGILADDLDEKTTSYEGHDVFWSSLIEDKNE